MVKGLPSTTKVKRMATTEATVKVAIAKINRGAVSAIVSAIAKGLAEVNSTGALLHSVCNVARAQYKGAAIPKIDGDEILRELAITHGWKGRTVDIRKSEYRAVLAAYAQLPEAMKALKSAGNSCSWHDGIALARLLRDGTKPAAAAKKHQTRRKAKVKDLAVMARGEAKALAARLVKKLLKLKKIESDFRDALKELCAAHSINV